MLPRAEGATHDQRGVGSERGEKLVGAQGCFRELENLVCGIGSFAWNDFPSRHASEPGELTLGKLSGCCNRLLSP